MIMNIPTWAYAVAAYFLLRPKGGESASTDIPPKKPVAVKGEAWTPAPTPITLQTDTRYFARLSVPSIATAEMIKDKFESIGFKDVLVWMGAPPASAPSSTKGQSGPFVLGTWGKPTRTTTLASEIAEAWVEAS
jgi:hypothetical protein